MNQGKGVDDGSAGHKRMTESVGYRPMAVVLTRTDAMSRVLPWRTQLVV